MATNEINLLKRNTQAIGAMHDLEDKLRLAAWWSLVALFAAGILIGTAYMVLNARTSALENRNAGFARQINAQSIKEGILVSLLGRTQVAGKAVHAARPWGNLFPLLNTVSSEEYYRALTVDEAGKVSVQMKLDSVDQAVEIVNTMIDLNADQDLRFPYLQAFTIQDDGTINMGMTFVPNF